MNSTIFMLINMVYVLLYRLPGKYSKKTGKCRNASFRKYI